MVTIIAGIIMLGILVFVHEFGHFCVAKLSGVKVLKFSLGFGPRLLSRQWGETEYMICAVPLGGYVQMLGEGNGEQGEGAELTEEELERSFANKPVSRRTAIVAAGPLMNLVLPFLILPLAYLLGVNVPAFFDREVCVGYVAQETAAERAGFVAGDCVVAINGQDLPSWDAANKSLISFAGSELVFDLLRDGRPLQLTIGADDNSPDGLQTLGLLPDQEANIGVISPGMPASMAGMKVGDRILTIDQEEVSSWYDLKRFIQAAEGASQIFIIERDGEQLELEVQATKTDDEAGYLVGIAPLQDFVLKRYGLGEAITAGADRARELIGLTLVFLQKLFSGHISSKSIGGPITVVQIAGQAAQTDVSSILFVLAFLSIQLGILNLLPIPILDGGHLFFYLFEIVLRKPLSPKARDIAQQVGLVLLVMLMMLAFYNDFMRLLFDGVG